MENHVSTSTPFGLYINKEEGGGVCGLLGRGGVHMVTLYWGPVPLMGRASGAWAQTHEKKHSENQLSQIAMIVKRN